MILDNIANLKKYSALYPGFRQAGAFIIKNRSGNISDGRYDIDGKNVFALVSTSKGKGLKLAKLEAHKKYIDIQYVLWGREVIGYQQTKNCVRMLAKYDTKKDIMFFKDEPGSVLVLEKGDFAVFFPNDAHAPIAGKGMVKKIVVKVKV